jgi:TetR/AcrR family transcriptional repressor of nem operon
MVKAMTKTTAKQKAIAAAQELMTSGGYSATTVDEIINLAGVSKGSVYHAFKSKEALAITALEDYEQKGWEILANGPYVKEADPIKRAVAFVTFIENKAPELWSHGCLLGSISLEVANRHPVLHTRIDELFDEFENAIARVFAPALQAAEVKNISAKDLARHMLAVIEGSIITAKSHRRPELLTDGLRHFRHYLEMLLKL